MERSSFLAEVPGGALHGWIARAAGPPVLLLHGGPGMSYLYLDGLACELGDGFRVAAYQQRGVAPSTAEGPFAVEQEVADALAVLDALGWERAWVAGHSWGGHLLLHLALAAPERLYGGLAVEPLGGTGDGGRAAFEAEMLRRIPAGDRERAEELDAQALRGEGGPEAALESMRLAWPAYFASPDHVMPFRDLETSVPAYAGLFASLQAALPRLAAELARVTVPLGFVAGSRSPMPYELAAAATARAVPGAWLELVPGAGHFPWFERPGCVRGALRRLTATAVRQAP